MRNIQYYDIFNIEISTNNNFMTLMCVKISFDMMSMYSFKNI